MAATMTTWIVFLLALAAVPAAGAGPATRPALPGADIDLRSACAVAAAVVVGEVEDVNAELSMSAFDGEYHRARLSVSKRLKGDVKGPLHAYLPVPSHARPDVALPPKKEAHVFFLWDDGGGFRAFKVVPAAPEEVRQVEADLAEQSVAAKAAAQPAAKPAAEAKKPSDLAATIVVPADARVEQGYLSGTLRLTNRSHTPVRVCTKGWEMTSDSDTGSGVHLMPGRFKSDTPPAYDFARHIVELAPGASTDVPVRFPIKPGTAAVRLTAGYEVDEEIGARLDIWVGNVSADPLDLQAHP